MTCLSIFCFVMYCCFFLTFRDWNVGCKIKTKIEKERTATKSGRVGYNLFFWGMFFISSSVFIVHVTD